jgi:hypothetical protein
MRFLTIGAAAALSLTATATLLQAQEPATYALKPTKAYEVGDLFTETETVDKSEKVVVTVMGEVVQNKDEQTKIAYTRITKVLAVDDKGKRTKTHLYFAKFSHAAGGFDDDTLTGKVIEFVKQADGRSSWRHHAGEGAIGPAATKWLDKKYKSGKVTKPKSDVDDIMSPPQPVAVGESWTPNLAALIENMGLPISEDKATATCSLEGIENRDGVELARVKFEATFPLDKFPGGPAMEVPWTKGGTMTFTMKAVMPTKARIAAGEKSGGYALDGEAEMQGALVNLSIKEENTEVRTLTGAIPDLPLIPVQADPAPPVVPPVVPPTGGGDK